MSNRTKHIDRKPARQGAEEDIAEPNKIGASTPYDFDGKNLTAYGGLLPVATMLEKLGFQQLVEETLTVKRVTRVMSMYQFVLSMILAIYVGFSRLHHLRFLQREPAHDVRQQKHELHRLVGVGAARVGDAQPDLAGHQQGERAQDERQHREKAEVAPVGGDEPRLAARHGSGLRQPARHRGCR